MLDIGDVSSLFADLLSDVISETIVSLLASFGCVTLVFACLEHQNVKINNKKSKGWAPGSLPPIPNDKALIKRSDCVVSMVFILLFGGLLFVAPELFGAYIFDNKEFVDTIPIFNLSKWDIILPFLAASFCLDFIDNLVRLLTGCYCNTVMYFSIATCTIQVAISFIVLKVLPFWNPDFADECSVAFNKDFTSKGDLLNYWNTDLISNIVLACIIIGKCVEIGITIYKTLTHGTKAEATE